MSQVKSYHIIRAEDPGELEAKVMNLLGDGWTILGQLIVTIHLDGSIIRHEFWQAMVFLDRELHPLDLPPVPVGPP